MQNYELYIIFDQQTSAEDCELALQNLMSDLKAENVTTEREGVKKFKYPIKKQWSGQYYLVTFDLSLENASNINPATTKLSRIDSIMRYIIVNQTDFLKQKEKEALNKEPEFSEHREYNKGQGQNKRCIVQYLGYRAIDYKDTEFLEQFMSPYSKIFGKARTGLKSKNQRKIAQAIERARHMGLLPYTDKWL